MISKRFICKNKEVIKALSQPYVKGSNDQDTYIVVKDVKTKEVYEMRLSYIRHTQTITEWLLGVSK